MRFIVMHRTEAKWEAGCIPDPELVKQVGQLMGGMARSGVLVGGDGLRSSALGARLQAGASGRTRVAGPYRASEGVPAGFVVMRVPSLDDAMAWSERLGLIMGEGDIDVRPLTEAWDIGLGPKPPDVTTTRFLALYKDPAVELGQVRARPKLHAMKVLLAEMESAGVLVSAVSLKPSAKGARLRRGGEVIDGPFAEDKELIGGFAILEVPSKAEALEWAGRYMAVVAPEEADVREVDVSGEG